MGKNTFPIILLTATVNPGKKIYTKLVDPNIRKTQYKEAIEFYLTQTKSKIVVCENSNFNLYEIINSEEKDERVEFLSFNGNDFDFNLGKSFGEALIIKYAFENSKFLQEELFFIKITGRVKVLNINKIIKKTLRLDNLNTILIELSYKNYAKSVCFVTSKEWMLKTIEKYIGSLNDSIIYNFEKMLFNSIIETNSIRIKKCFAKLDGISGTENLLYPNYSLPQLNLNHYNTLFNLYKKKNDRFNFIKNYIIWLFYIPIRKLYNFYKNEFNR